MLTSKRILVGITGGIAAYKVLELIRMFKRANADVKVVVTPCALEFVTVQTLQTLSGNKVYVEMFDKSEFCPHHICLTDCDLAVLAPLSANTLGKIANGVCDNLLTSTICAFQKPVIAAPAMNEGMWNNFAVQRNIEVLKQNGFIIMEPEIGELACKTKGVGRLCAVENIYNLVCEILCENDYLKGKKVVVTAGGTKEKIDPVRYIGNFSSGKMGLALADAAFEAGAEVELVCTFEVERKYKVTKVTSALDMLDSLHKSFPDCDSLIMAAAVADYRPYEIKNEKIKKDNDELEIKLIKNFDILSEMVKIKKEGQTVVGFCAETSNLIDNAKKKIQNKKCDYIVANDVETAMNKDFNEVTVIDKNFESKKFELDTKENIARKILEYIYDKN